MPDTPPVQGLPFHTIGHARLEADAFVTRLKNAEITLLVDVRAFPRSRTNPQFNNDTLPTTLAEQGIDYLHMRDLGGRRGRQAGVAADINGAWENESFHHYADWALQSAFEAALSELRRLGQQQRCAIMCAESVWWRCHRRIIADHLLAAGETVRHIMDAGIEDASLTPFAEVDDAGKLSYPAQQQSLGL